MSSSSVILPPVDAQHIPLLARWDLDKTYLRTEFDTVKQLFRSAFEKAEEKRAVPGAPALLRELKNQGSRICIISGSPEQMRTVLERKLRLDEVEFDEFVLKPNLRNLLRLRFRALKEQIGYKLPALLQSRRFVVAKDEVCFGDDAEADAFIYSLYADLLAGRASKDMLKLVLVGAGLYEDTMAMTLALADAVAHGETVRRIFIHLDRHSPPSRFDAYGARLVPIYNYFQAVLVLYSDGIISGAAVARVVFEMVEKFGYNVDALRNSLQDLVRRGRLTEAITLQLGRDLRETAIPASVNLPDGPALIRSFARRIAELGTMRPLPAPAEIEIDYVKLLARELPHLRTSG